MSIESICDSSTLGTVQLGAGLQADAPNVPLPSPEELAVHWLGGYWKLPKQDMASTDLRERVVSTLTQQMVKTSPTTTVPAYVMKTHGSLHE